MSFSDNVFINCPFDDDYLSILRPVLFCVIDLGLAPRIALERTDSGQPRVLKIIDLIRTSKFAIHDLSRLRASRRGEFYRLNMPFELGLDVGCRVFGTRSLNAKRCLILEAERYRYQAAISDMSNSDIAVHGNDPLRALTEVRNWLSAQRGTRTRGPAAVWSRFNDFMAAMYVDLTERGYSKDDVARLPVPELVSKMKSWIAAHPA
ncbi:hypothetical protein CCR97_25635 [Rhodoplanes elegans]|uniref:Uncharacterized protein n=1 Tax=Rhodoplanes elegans TaxID=29408 RepID=A0A327KNQ0_9BRAD|nr:hypothetical protein [Rhodoplanes elegans]MBK5961562.1 hypothetical protein [Rhodoplanes elegans]RAI39971.1 hypothetical protein CH338_07730 [Rhodoplanes elegans]